MTEEEKISYFILHLGVCVYVCLCVCVCVCVCVYLTLTSPAAPLMDMKQEEVTAGQGGKRRSEGWGPH